MHYVQADDLYDLADSIDADVRENYSGRGMFGDKCVAMTFDGPVATAMLKLGIAMCELSEDADGFGGTFDKALLHHMSNTAVVDSMGLGTVVYWPNVKVALED